MTTTERVIDEQRANEALDELVRIERAIDRAYQEIADSLGLKDRKAVEKHIDSLRGDIKKYLTERGGELHEGEHGWGAKLQSRNTSPSYDIVSCVDTEEGRNAVIEAGYAGMVRVDNTMLERFRGSAGAAWADVLYRYRMPGGTTEALIIERGR